MIRALALALVALSAPAANVTLLQNELPRATTAIVTITEA